MNKFFVSLMILLSSYWAISCLPVSDFLNGLNSLNPLNSQQNQQRSEQELKQQHGETPNVGFQEQCRQAPKNYAAKHYCSRLPAWERNVSLDIDLWSGPPQWLSVRGKDIGFIKISNPPAPAKNSLGKPQPSGAVTGPDYRPVPYVKKGPYAIWAGSIILGTIEELEGVQDFLDDHCHYDNPKPTKEMVCVPESMKSWYVYGYGILPLCQPGQEQYVTKDRPVFSYEVRYKSYEEWLQYEERRARVERHMPWLSTEKLWNKTTPVGTIPYEIDSSVSDRKSEIGAAMEVWTRASPIRFIPRTSEKDYIVFRLNTFDPDGCYSYYGRSGGPQEVELGANCTGIGRLAYTLGHVVGFLPVHVSGFDGNGGGYYAVNTQWCSIAPEAQPFFVPVNDASACVMTGPPMGNPNRREYCPAGSNFPMGYRPGDVGIQGADWRSIMMLPRFAYWKEAGYTTLYRGIANWEAKTPDDPAEGNVIRPYFNSELSPIDTFIANCLYTMGGGAYGCRSNFSNGAQ